MPKNVRIWEILAEEELEELIANQLDLENRIETWLEKDISIISDDLLVIGRQVGTSFGGVIDLLCLDSNGDAVIVELKRDKTPRDITAQVLDYASWVQDLSSEQIIGLADQFLGEQGPLEQVFEQRFEEELPETLNDHHRMLIVASKIDGSTERILNYLSDTYGVDINAVSFQYFRQDDQREFLARVFLIEPSQVEYSARTKSTSKRRHRPSYADFQEIADDRGIGEIYFALLKELPKIFDSRSRSKNAIAFVGKMKGSQKTIISLFPRSGNPEKGFWFRTYIDRLATYLDASKDDILNALPPNIKDYEPWQGAPPCVAGYFGSQEEVSRFVAYLREIKED